METGLSVRASAGSLARLALFSQGQGLRVFQFATTIRHSFRGERFARIGICRFSNSAAATVTTSLRRLCLGSSALSLVPNVEVPRRFDSFPASLFMPTLHRLLGNPGAVRTPPVGLLNGVRVQPWRNGRREPACAGGLMGSPGYSVLGIRFFREYLSFNLPPPDLYELRVERLPLGCGDAVDETQA